MKLTKLFTSKRAADPNQIFIYISAIVIVGFVFLYGFKAVATFINSSQEIELAKFVKDFKSSATSVSADFGSIKYVTIRIPSQFTKMCVIDIEKSAPASCPNELGQEICDAWTDYSDASLEKKNIFFVDQAKHVGYKDRIESIVLDYGALDSNNAPLVNSDGYFCTNDGRLKLEGSARQAMISPAEN